MINYVEFFDQLLRYEKEAYSYIIDVLASEYGWTIEYIQNLTLPEISLLLKTIRRRKDLEDRITQLNVAKGFSGRISSNYVKESKVRRDEISNLNLLAKMLGKKVTKVNNGTCS